MPGRQSPSALLAGKGMNAVMPAPLLTVLRGTTARAAAKA
jgi:hypothetical protein